MASAAPKNDKPAAAAAAEAKAEQPTAEQKSAAALEEDDEFEDFPVDGAFIFSPRPKIRRCHAD